MITPMTPERAQSEPTVLIREKDGEYRETTDRKPNRVQRWLHRLLGIERLMRDMREMREQRREDHRKIERVFKVAADLEGMRLQVGQQVPYLVAVFDDMDKRVTYYETHSPQLRKHRIALDRQQTAAAAQLVARLREQAHAPSYTEHGVKRGGTADAANA
jgi:hypothetical protein